MQTQNKPTSEQQGHDNTRTSLYSRTSESCKHSSVIGEVTLGFFKEIIYAFTQLVVPFKNNEAQSITNILGVDLLLEP